MTCFVYRPVSYDGVIEPGKARGMSITQRGEINVDTLGTPSKRSSLERWGSGSGEVENVMRRASMDVDEDPGTPTAKSGGKAASPTPFGSGFDSTVGGAHGNGIETIPNTGVSIAANPFRDACFKSVTMSDEDERTRTLRETFRGAKFSRDRDGIGRDRIGPRFGFENVYSHRSDRDVGESMRENFTDERVQTDIREQRRGESERVRGRDGEGRL